MARKNQNLVYLRQRGMAIFKKRFELDARKMKLSENSVR